MLNEKIKKINELNERKSNLEKEIEDRKKEIETLESEIDPLKSDVMSEMKSTGLKEYHNDGLVVFLSSRKTTGYSKEEEKQILDILRNQNLNSCISIKESLSKKELNKELKSNTSLKELLSPYGAEKVSEYISVMTEESALKRQQAIEESKNK